MTDSPASSSSGSRHGAITFAGFVLSLAHTTAVHFGDVPDPVTGAKGQANPDAARQMIEILGLLEEKTRGNLTAEERQLVEQVLYELRMRAVQVPGATSAPGSRIVRP